MQYTPDDIYKGIVALFGKVDTYGENTMCNCPFHADKTPSLSIHNTTGMYRCFSAKCKRQGHLSSLCYELTKKPLYSLIGKSADSDFIQFSYMHKQSTPFVRGKVEQTNPKTIEEIEKDIKIDIRGVETPWHESREAIKYLESRYISHAVADAHKMYYMDSGYINGYYYTKRLCIPIYGKSGKLLAVEGRDVTGKADKKCIYPYNSIKPVYDFDKLDLSKPVTLFEGLTKKASAQSDPYFNNSTNVFGSQISKYQKLYLTLIPHLIICPDNDEAGEEMVNDIKNFYTGILQVLRIQTTGIVDHDQIPKKLGMSIKEYRERGGLKLTDS